MRGYSKNMKPGKSILVAACGNPETGKLFGWYQCNILVSTELEDGEVFPFSSGEKAGMMGYSKNMEPEKSILVATCGNPDTGKSAKLFAWYRKCNILVSTELEDGEVFPLLLRGEGGDEGYSKYEARKIHFGDRVWQPGCRKKCQAIWVVSM